MPKSTWRTKSTDVPQAFIPPTAIVGKESPATAEDAADRNDGNPIYWQYYGRAVMAFLAPDLLCVGMVQEIFLMAALALPPDKGHQLARLRAFLSQTHYHYDIVLDEPTEKGWKLAPFTFGGYPVWMREKLKENA
jgi:hypothetical protein